VVVVGGGELGLRAWGCMHGTADRCAAGVNVPTLASFAPCNAAASTRHLWWFAYVTLCQRHCLCQSWPSICLRRGDQETYV
jgi:hypothetical protein